MKLFNRKKKTGVPGLMNTFQHIFIMSPLFLVGINLIIMIPLYLMAPGQLKLAKWGFMILIFATVNGWIVGGILFSYVFRDQSHKFQCPVFSCSLGERLGLLNYVPPYIKIIDGIKHLLEPQFTIRRLGGFSAMGIHIGGKVLSIYPTKYEVIFPGGGVQCYCWLRETHVDELPKNVRDMLVRVGTAHGIFVTGHTTVWFSRSIYDVGEMIPEPELWDKDTLCDELNAEINRLKGLKGHLEFQEEQSAISKSLNARRETAGAEDFLSDYHEPTSGAGERAQGMTRAEIEDYDRKRKRGY